MDDERYEGEPSLIDEGDRATWRLKRRTRPVIFQNLSGETPDWEQLREALERSRQRLSVKRVCLDATSRMADGQLLTLFPKAETVDIWNRGAKDLSIVRSLTHVRRLSIVGRRSRSCSLDFVPELSLEELYLRVVAQSDVQVLNNCGDLEFLEVQCYPFEDLEALGKVRANRLSLASGKIVRVAGSRGRQSTMFTGCRSLTDLSGLTSAYIQLDSCHKVDLNTVGDVHGLETMWICGRKSIDDWGFLRRCETLRELVVSGTRVTAQDWSAIVDSACLELVWLGYPVSDKVIEMIGRANQRVVVTNGHLCMAKGVPDAIEAYYRVEKDLQRRRRRRKQSDDSRRR